MKARCIHSDVCILLDETTKDCYDTFTDGTPHNCEYYLSGDFQNQKEKVLDEIIEFMKNKIRLPTNSGEQLSYEADIRFKVISEVKKELRQSKDGE